jgi:single-stranded-DNA-specific exonuclease
MSLFDRILIARGLLDNKSKATFLSPDYSGVYDPFLLSDMTKAVERLVIAYKSQEHIVIYGDYDIDGLTATTLLLDAFESFGFKNVKSIIPSRFVEGYGLTVEAVEGIAADGADLIVTVDCGSRNEKEIARANELGLDVVVTDHHNLAETLPSAIAVINPKRIDSDYPFIDLAGVGVAFKLVQAMQTRLVGLPKGQEKWLLDLVALGTVCDVVSLTDENRTNVFWGLKVLAKTKRLGLKALMAVAKIEPSNINTRALGFGIGPRMNAAGRLETAKRALDVLTTDSPIEAMKKAQYLDDLNTLRRTSQDKIFKEAIVQAEKYSSDPVLVVSDANWNYGIVGIVASKLLEKYKKPAYVLQEIDDESRGSARSYGDFSAADAIYANQDVVIKGGGHKLAAGVTLLTKDIAIFRKRVNEFYKKQELVDQYLLLLPVADTYAELNELNEELVDSISQLEPFGNGNHRPILKTENLLVIKFKEMGTNGQHVKLELSDNDSKTMQFLAFNAPKHFFATPGSHVTVWYYVGVNEWQGRRSVECELLNLVSV